MIQLYPFLIIEQTIKDKNLRAIRLEKLKKDRDGQTVEQFLIKFFTEWNDNRNTIYVDNRDIQTPIGKRRSLGDIYMICLYYFPECSLKDVLDILYNQLLSSMPDGFRSSYCSTINKRVWYFDSMMILFFSTIVK